LRTNRKWFIVLAVVSILALVAAGCSKSTTNTGGDKGTTTTPAPAEDKNKPVDGGTLTIGTFSDMVTLNPFVAQDTSSGQIQGYVLASLFDVDAKANLVADEWAIAKEPYKVSADGKTYSIKIRTDAKWSDGSPITIDDVVWSFQMYSTEAVGYPGYSSYAQVQEVKKTGNDSFDIILKDVDARFDYALNNYIAPKKVFEGVKPEELGKAKYGTDPKSTITSGPYKWTEWVEKQYIKVDRDANYWGKKPNIQTIVQKIYTDQNTEVQALLKGEVDFLDTIQVAHLDVLKGQSNLHVDEGAAPSYDYLAFNFNPDNWPKKVSPFASAKTRIALNYAINRKGMVDSVLTGHGALLNGPFLPGAWADTPEAATNFAYDVNKAKQMLAEDGWKAGSDGILVKDGVKFEFELMTNAGNKRRESFAAIIQQNLKDVGINVILKPMDFSALVDCCANTGKFQALLLGWQLGLDPDAESLFSSKFYPPAGQNAGFYKNEKTDALWEKGYKVVDKAQRKAIYADILKEFAQDPPYIFLAMRNDITAFNDKVHWAPADKPVHSIGYGTQFHIFNWWVTK
jgi:peptide/nickel transport system substrate-binding protein